jgi:predicted dehydrogenase
MQIQQMADHGAFGDMTYGFGAYIHEIRHMGFAADGSLTWRGHNTAEHIGIIYPTHAIGPVCRWLGINKTDKLQTIVCMASKSAAVTSYAKEKFGENSPQAKVTFLNGDTTQALIKTEQGRLVEVRYDTASPRPPGMGQFSLQGTKGAYESDLGERMVYLEGKTNGEKWEPLEQYANEYRHPYWKEHGEIANKSGHGGGDYFVISDFLDAIRTGKSAIDVYDAVTWSSIRPLSAKSLEAGSAPVPIPDFRTTKSSQSQ